MNVAELERKVLDLIVRVERLHKKLDEIENRK